MIPRSRTCVRLTLLLLIALAAAEARIAAQPDARQARIDAFDTELADLVERLGVAGLAYAVIEDEALVHIGRFGGSVENPSEAFTADTPLNIQSITKSMAAVIVMQLVEAGHLALDAPVSTLLPDADVPDAVQLRHLLSHTSEGRIGWEYVYSPGRYGLLAEIIARATDGSYERAFREQIIEAAGMSWYDSPQLGAASGLVTTVDELVRYVQALDRGELLTDATLHRLATPSTSPDGVALPTSLGWSTQSIQGVPVVWSYGQSGDQGAGALLFRVPERKLTLVVLANNNVISDRFRLLAGDVGKSPFAMAFYRLFVASPPGRLLPRPDWNADDIEARLRRLEASVDYRYEGEMIAQVLIARFHGRPERAEALFDIAWRHYELASRPNPVVHYTTQELSSRRIKSAGIEMGRRLLAAHPDNRWILLFQGHLLQAMDIEVEAVGVFNRILNLPNQNQDVLHRLFDTWCWYQLAQLHRAERPAEARRYLTLIIESGVGGDAKREAEAMLDALR